MKPSRSSYSEKLRDPRWQKKRLEILERDNWCCQICFDSESTLAVHHRRYMPSREPWDYPETCLVALCESCHEAEKDCMNDSLDSLAEQLKEKFFSADIKKLASAINGLRIIKSSEITADIIEWIFRNDDLMDRLDDLFFESLTSKNKGNDNAEN